jgi:hypothetical protein
MSVNVASGKDVDDRSNLFTVGSCRPPPPPPPPSPFLYPTTTTTTTELMITSRSVTNKNSELPKSINVLQNSYITDLNTMHKQCWQILLIETYDYQFKVTKY